MVSYEDLWYKNAIFYEVSIKSFKDSNNDGIGDIQGLISKLDYIEDLGINCLWLLPFYPSPWKDDGYDVANYYDVHPDMGTMDDFEELLEETEKRGIKIIIDLVANHTSDQHEWFQKSRENKDNPYRDYYVWSDTDKKYENARVIFTDYEDSNWTYDERTDQYYWHRFYHHQPDLNYDNPQVHKEIFNIIDFWLEKGIAGFRVDAIPYLYERENTTCENLPETHRFLQLMRSHVDEKYGENEKILMCESNMWQEDLIPYFGDSENPEFHMGFDFPVMTRIYEALARQNVQPLLDVLQIAHELPKDCQWATFLRNHDELTLEKVTPEVRKFMWEYYASDQRARINLGIRKRLAPLLENDRRKLELLNVFLFALPGSPIIYYGDEIGMGDNLHLPDRDGVRTPMQWNETKNAGFSNAEEKDLIFPIIMDEIYGYKTKNVENQKVDPNSLLNFMKDLIKKRQNYSFIGYGEFRVVNQQHNKGIVFHHADENIELYSLFNYSDEKIKLTIDEIKQGNEIEVNDVFGSKKMKIGQNIVLEPFEYKWYIINHDDNE